MLLTIDVGNTNIATGIYDGDSLVGSFRLTSQTKRTSDELGMLLCNMMATKGITPSMVEAAIVSSVVPKLMHSLRNALYKFFEIEPIMIGPGIKTGIKLLSSNPKEVGADRLVNVAAAYHLYQKACLVIDFGTATTFDFVSADGVFEYAVITPGIEISLEALVSHTAKLPDIEIVKPNSILAKTTIDTMQAGLVYGYIGQVEYIVHKLREELACNFHVIATGGLGRIIAPHTTVIKDYDPDLAYKGMKILYDKNVIH